jgi:hypothetical protein
VVRLDIGTEEKGEAERVEEDACETIRQHGWVPDTSLPATREDACHTLKPEVANDAFLRRKASLFLDVM